MGLNKHCRDQSALIHAKKQTVFLHKFKYLTASRASRSTD